MIAIVGGGWFGCHIAKQLKERGTPFRLFEQRARLFDGASGFNQHRLHLGFHYPRTAATRRQSRVGFGRFVEEYPGLSSEVDRNIYAMPKHRSVIDFETYKTIMRHDNLHFTEVDAASLGLVDVEGAVVCRERLIETNQARDYFTRILGDSVEYQSTVTNYQSLGFDQVVNCTYQTWQRGFQDIHYEPCVMLLAASESRQALTLVDGPFNTIYPFEPGLSTVYSVRRSRLGSYGNYQFAQQHLDRFTQEDWRSLCRVVTAEIERYYPAFRDMYQFVDCHKSVRCCSTAASDERVCRILQQGNVIHVLSGKIDSIFYAAAEVLACLDS